MAQTLSLKINGLHTYNNPLSGVPDGALKVAKNIMINRLNIAESRRGTNPADYALPNSSDRFKAFINYDDMLFAHYASTFGLWNSGSGWTSKGSLTIPTTAQEVRTVVANQNLYLTSSTGIKKLDGSATSSIYAAGLPKGTMMELSLSSGTGTAVEDTKFVTYRYIIGRYDANDNLVYGGVSGRYTIENTAGSSTIKDIDVLAYIPDGLTTSHFVQVYRSVGLDAEGSDELFLNYEANLTSTDISNGYVSFTDITPDSLLGETLYTSPSQEGISQDNSEPPLCTDISLFQGHTFFSDIEDKHRFQFTIIACGGSDGIQVDDTITISDGSNTEVYTAKSSFDDSNKEFVVDTASGSFAVRNASTAESLVKCINLASDYWVAFLISTGDNLPGQIRLEAKNLGDDQFNVTSDRSTAFNPPLASTATSAQYSDNTAIRNGIRYSKTNAPEEVPLANFLRIGNSSPILRIKALRDGLFIFKETDGVFVLRGTTPADFTINPLDDTALLVAPKTLRAVNNQIYAVFEAGIGRVSDTGVDYIHKPIKDKVLPLYAAPLDELKQYSFGITYETEGKYILSLPRNENDTATYQQFIYDVYGQSWTEWDLDLTAGIVSKSDGKLYLGESDSAVMRIERKEFDFTDFCDKVGLVTISSYSGTTLTISDTDLMTQGDLLIQGETSAYIESVDYAGGTVEIDYEQTWTTGVATVEHLSGINCELEWNTESGGNPAGFKQFYEGALLFKQKFIKQGSLFFYSDQNPSESSYELSASSGNGAWGDFLWGEEVWGGEQVENTRRFGVPRTHSRCNILSVRFTTRAAYNDFQVSGLSLVFNPVSTRVSR